MVTYDRFGDLNSHKRSIHSCLEVVTEVLIYRRKIEDGIEDGIQAPRLLRWGSINSYEQRIK